MNLSSSTEESTHTKESINSQSINQLTQKYPKIRHGYQEASLSSEQIGLCSSVVAENSVTKKT